MNGKIRAVLLDFNGTMLYDSPIHRGVWEDFIPAHGGKLGTPEENEKHLFGCSNRHILTTYLPGLSEEEIARLTYEKEAEYRRRCAADDKIFRLVDGLPEFLDALRAEGMPMTIATGSERLNVEFYFSSPKLGLARWFDPALVVYDDFTFPGKPAPDVYLLAAAKLGVPCGDCLVFEDSLSGVQSARNAGARYVVALGGSPAEKFDAVGGVDLSVPDFTAFRSFPGLWDNV